MECDVSTPPNLNDMLHFMEQKLLFSLKEARATYKHAGVRGSSVEKEIRDLLQGHLPQYLQVGTGEVIDQADTRSGQIDVVVSNQDQPFHRGIHEDSVFLVEGVAAAAEVKSRLTTKDLEMAISSGRRLKALRNTHLKGDLRHATDSDGQRFYDCPPYFLVALESTVSPQTLIDTLSQTDNATAEDGSGTPLSPLDAAFILGKGWAINFGDGQGSLQWRSAPGDAESSVAGWVWVSAERVLIELLMWLSAVMPRVHRSGAISVPYLMARERPQIPLLPSSSEEAFIRPVKPPIA